MKITFTGFCGAGDDAMNITFTSFLPARAPRPAIPPPRWGGYVEPRTFHGLRDAESTPAPGDPPEDAMNITFTGCDCAPGASGAAALRPDAPSRGKRMRAKTPSSFIPFSPRRGDGDFSGRRKHARARRSPR